MRRVDILTLGGDADGAVRALAKEGSFHPVDQRVRKAHPGFEARPADEALIALCDGQKAIADALLRRLGAPAGELAAADLDSILSRAAGDLVGESRRALEKARAGIEASFREREETLAEIARLDEISEQMHLLDDNGLSAADARRARRFHVVHGVVGREVAGRLAGLAGCGVLAHAARPLRGREVSVLLVGDPGRKAELDAWLVEAGFRRREIPERFHGPVGQSMDLVEAELWELRDRHAELTRKYRAARDGWAAELSFWSAALRIHGMLLRSGARFGARGQAVLISGFVPESSWPSLRARLERSVPGRYAAQAAPADRAEGLQVPTRLRNRGIFRPFELFVKTYGTPGYDDVDPTPLVAVSFLAMFGMMFGDVGHGAMLAAIGGVMAFARRRALAGLRELGKILMMAGGSGILFGLLFGSVFGVEKDSVLPALWMRPSHAENLTRFLGAALVLGVGVLSAGIGMGILQSARRKDATKALIGQWSASSLAFYWAVLALLGAQMLGRPVPVPSGVAVAALAAPLALIGFGQILAHRFRKRGDGHEGGEEEPATVMFEAVEVVMNLFANSVSFLRVAAFGLAHAALTTAVFVIEDMIRVPGSSVVSQPFEHLFIVALEGMIVTIQCLRLEYYEFFSKFFSGGGLPYAPISVDAE